MNRLFDEALGPWLQTATTFLDENRRATIEVSWVPGHMGIKGNDRADTIAKEATELEPATMAKLLRQLRERMKTEWISEQTTNRSIRHSRPHATLLGRITRIPHT